MIIIGYVISSTYGICTDTHRIYFDILLWRHTFIAASYLTQA